MFYTLQSHFLQIELRPFPVYLIEKKRQFASIFGPKNTILVSKLVGVEFIDENGGGPGVRLRKRHQKKS